MAVLYRLGIKEFAPMFDGMRFSDGWVGAPVPDDEKKRLATLRSYGVLDTPPEALFDHITMLARTLFCVPVALVSLVDEDRQWFKSRCGDLEQNETPRAMAFCAYTVARKSLFVVQDARKDDRFRNNPLVAGEPGVRFYAGAPLTTPDGYVIGSLCLIDTIPHRTFSDKDGEVLKALAQLVMDGLQLNITQAAAKADQA